MIRQNFQKLLSAKRKIKRIIANSMFVIDMENETPPVARLTDFYEERARAVYPLATEHIYTIC